MRLVDSSITEYQLGSGKIIEFWRDKSSLNIGAIHRATSHFETCISNMHRAIRCFVSLRRGHGDPFLIFVNSIDASFKKNDGFAKIVKRLRDEIQHLEEDVVKGRVVAGHRFALSPDGPETPHPSEKNQTIKTIDRLVIGRSEVKFSDIAIWLKEMASVASKISEYNPSNQSPKPPSTSRKS